jgi:hypothetical protein
MPHAARGLSLVCALALVGCSLGDGEGGDKVEQPRITKAQLAAMVLPRTDVGPIAAAMKPNDEAGPVGNAEAADDSIDPADTASSLTAAGRVAGHKLYYVGGKRGALLIGTEVELLRDPVYAAQYLHKQLSDLDRFQGQTLDGIRLRRAANFEVLDVGDEGEGVEAVLSMGRRTFHWTLVAFRRGRLIGAAAVLRADAVDARQQVRTLAAKFDRRIQSVLSGDIEPAPTEENTEDAALAGQERLPALTLAAADVAPGARPVDQGLSKHDDYVSYHRTFEDVVVGQSHLMTLRALAHLYRTPESAAAAYRLVTKPAGRKVFADGVVEGLGKDMKPRNMDIRAMENPGRGMTGVVVTFNLATGRYRVASIFMRSGRVVQSVTGFCRVSDFDPDDLKPVAERASRRLAA